MYSFFPPMFLSISLPIIQRGTEGFWKSVAHYVPREPTEMRILNPYFIQEAAFQFIGLPLNNGLMGKGVRHMQASVEQYHLENLQVIVFKLDYWTEKCGCWSAVSWCICPFFLIRYVYHSCKRETVVPKLYNWDAVCQVSQDLLASILL